MIVFLGYERVRECGPASVGFEFEGDEVERLGCVNEDGGGVESDGRAGTGVVEWTKEERRAEVAVDNAGLGGSKAWKRKSMRRSSEVLGRGTARPKRKRAVDFMSSERECGVGDSE